MWKKGFIILLGLALLVCVADAALDYVYFAGPGKVKAEKMISQQLGVPVKMEKLIFHLVTGFSARNVEIFDPVTRKHFAQIEKLDILPSYLGLLTKKWIIHKIRLKNPTIHLTRESNGKWNIPIKRSSSSENNLLWIQRFQIKGGTFFIQDLAQPLNPPLTYHLSLLKLNAEITKELNFKSHIQFFLSDKQNSAPAFISANAFVNFPNFKFKVNGSLDQFPIPFLTPFFQQSSLQDLKTFSGYFNGQFSGEGSLEDQVQFNVQVSTPSFELGFTPYQLSGGLSLNASLVKSSIEADWLYQGDAKLIKGEFQSSFLPSPIKNLKGKLLFKNRFLTTNNLEGQIDGKSIRLKGSMENIHKIKATLFTDLGPDKIAEIAQPFHPPFLNQLSISGKSFTQLELRTQADQPLYWQGKLYLREAQLKIPEYKLSYENLNGLITFEEKGMHFKNLTGTLSLEKPQQIKAQALINGKWLRSSLKDKSESQNISIKLSKGTIQIPLLDYPMKNFNSQIELNSNKIELKQFKFESPFHHYSGKGSFALNAPHDLHLYLSSSDFSLLLQGEKEKEEILVKKLSGYGWGASYELLGQIPFNRDNPFILKGKLKVNSISLKKSWPQLWEKYAWLKEWSPKGTFLFKGEMKGSKKESWQLNTTLSGKRVRIRNVFFDHFTSQLNRQNREIHFDQIKGAIGNGKLNGALSFDLKNKPSRYQLDFQAHDIDIQKLHFSNGLFNPINFKGTFNGSLFLQGLSRKPETAKGALTFQITDGKLWETPLFKPIWPMISNIAPHLEKPTFNTVKGDFNIESGNLKTDNFQLEGTGLILSSTGSVGIDKTINMVFKIKFLKSEGSIIKKIAANSLNLFGKLLEIHYTGTLSNPKVKRRWLPILGGLIDSDNHS